MARGGIIVKDRMVEYIKKRIMRLRIKGIKFYCLPFFNLIITTKKQVEKGIENAEYTIDIK